MSTRVTRGALKRQAEEEKSIQVSKMCRIVQNSEKDQLAISKEVIVTEIATAQPFTPKTKQRGSKKVLPKSVTVTEKTTLVTTGKSTPKKRSPTKAAERPVAVPTLPPAVLPPGATPDTLLRNACAHLIAVEPRFESLIKRHHCKLFSPESLATIMDPFTALTSSIISQQVSGAAAATIQRRFIALFHDKDAVDPPFPNPAQVAAADILFLRQAGLSQRKAEFIQGLAASFASGELSPEILNQSSDEEVMEKLIAVRGLGKWTVEMFICFGLKRIDVFSVGDLTVQRGVAAFIGKDASKLKSKSGQQEMLDISAKFAPYRSLFMWYMWKVIDDINSKDAL
ncbi:3-methyladenine DNA glycosylase [Aspergillus hancockii]|nr:3-methyladenine DNA glycosylase [Aspergillus hancockii]